MTNTASYYDHFGYKHQTTLDAIITEITDKLQRGVIDFDTPKAFFDCARLSPYWQHIHTIKPRWKFQQPTATTNPAQLQVKKDDYVAFRHVIQALLNNETPLLDNKTFSWEYARPLMAWAEQQRHRIAYNRAEVAVANMRDHEFARLARLLQNSDFDAGVHWLQQLVDGKKQSKHYFPVAKDEQYAILYHIVNCKEHNLKQRFEQAWQQDPDMTVNSLYRKLAHQESANNNNNSTNLDNQNIPVSQPITASVQSHTTLNTTSIISPNILNRWVMLCNPSATPRRLDSLSNSMQKITGETTRNTTTLFLEQNIKNARQLEAEQYTQKGYGLKAKIVAAAPLALALGGAAYFLFLFTHSTLVLLFSTATPIILWPLIGLGALIATSAIVSLSYAFLSHRAQQSAQQAHRLLKQFKIGNVVVRAMGEEPSLYHFDWNPSLEQHYTYVNHILEHKIGTQEKNQLIDFLKSHQFTDIHQKKIKADEPAKMAIALLHKLVASHCGSKLQSLPLEQQYRLLIEVANKYEAKFSNVPGFDNLSHIPKPTSYLTNFSYLISTLQTRVLQAQQLAYHRAYARYYRNSSIYWGSGSILATTLSLVAFICLSSWLGILTGGVLISSTIIGFGMMVRSFIKRKQTIMKCLGIETQINPKITTTSYSNLPPPAALDKEQVNNANSEPDEIEDIPFGQCPSEAQCAAYQDTANYTGVRRRTARRLNLTTIEEEQDEELSQFEQQPIPSDIL